MGQKFDSRYISVLARIRSKIALSRLALWVEVVARRFWPFASFAMAVYAFLAFGGLGVIPQAYIWSSLAAIIVVGFALLVWGFWQFKAPGTHDAIERLDKDLEGHPLASLRDKSAVGDDDPLTKALWEKHQARMVERTLAAKAAPPKPDLVTRDKNGLRLMALVAAIMAIVFAPRTVTNLVDDVLVTPGEAAVAGLSYEAWANPPGYTGKPSIYMLEVPNGDTLTVPEGTTFVFRVYGLGGAVSIETDVDMSNELMQVAQPGLYSSEFTADQNGDIQLLEDGRSLAGWKIIVEDDQSPEIQVSGDLTNDGYGVMQLPFQATDDYAVARGTATITLDIEKVDRRFGLVPEPADLAPIEIDLPLPFSGDRADIEEILSDDLSEHMWNGLPVRIDLVAEDDAGQQGMVSFYGDDLPGQRFYVPLAAAVAEMRRDIMWSGDNHQRVLQVLKAMTYLPEDYHVSTSMFLNLRAIVRRFEVMLENGLDTEEEAEITAFMWDVALQIEAGDINNARERLERAQERLANALEEGADQAEIDQLMDELRDATDDYLQALADEALQNGDQQQQQPSDGQSMELSMQDLQEMLDRLQELTENGQTAEAQELLEQLMELLQNLEMSQQEGEGQGPGAQRMQDMQDTLNDQQGLSDETFEELQDQQDGEGGNADELAERQEALREQLEDLQQQGGAGEESLEEAERNMADARDALEEGDLGRALDEQAEAMENLRQTMRELTEEMQQAEAEGSGQQQSTENDSEETDPLGRPLGENGQSVTGEDLLPEQEAMDRARELLDEIRRRSGDGERPEFELDYLDRLLENF